MVYGAEDILPTDLDYRAPTVVAYDEKLAEASLEQAKDELDEAHEVTLARSAKYP